MAENTRLGRVKQEFQEFKNSFQVMIDDLKVRHGQEVWKHQQETSEIKLSFKNQYGWSNKWKCYKH